ncbi:MAG: class I SAM-dependent methyltransferase [Bacteroidota bacterium]
MTNISKTKKNGEYRQLTNKPTPGELKKYYEDIYFQQSKGSYSKKYSDEEIRYLHNNLRIMELCLIKILNGELTGKTFLDLGCGEGWALKHFHSVGCKVIGIDYSSYGINTFNKSMLRFFTQLSLDEFISNSIKNKKKYDIVNMTNMIEHVLEPEKLLISIKRILTNDGVLCITFPNDFSPLHKLLLNKNKIQKEFWITSPDHISYFNKKSFLRLSTRLGYLPLQILADFPIDLFLLNNHSNYINERFKGKQAHFSRIDFVNLLCKLNINETINLLSTLGNIGLGRNLTVFLRIK